MHIGVERDGDVGVAKQPREGGGVAAEIHTIRREGVTQGVEVDVWHPGSAERGLKSVLKPARLHRRLRTRQDETVFGPAQRVEPRAQRRRHRYRPSGACALGGAENKFRPAGAVLRRDALQGPSYIYNVAIDRNIAPAEAAGFAQTHAGAHAEQYAELGGTVTEGQPVRELLLLVRGQSAGLAALVFRRGETAVELAAQPALLRGKQRRTQNMTYHPHRRRGIRFGGIFQEHSHVGVRHFDRVQRPELRSDVPRRHPAIGGKGRTLDPRTGLLQPLVQHRVKGRTVGR